MSIARQVLQPDIVDDLARQMRELERSASMSTSTSLEAAIRQRVGAWRELMNRHAVQARQILRKDPRPADRVHAGGS